MTIHGKDPSLLRRINEATTTRVLYDRRALTLTKLVGATGLSRRTAELVLDGLVERGLVEQIDPGGGGSVGRPARSFRFRTEAGACLGMAVRRTRVRAILTDLAGTPTASAQLPVARDAPRAERVAALLDCAREVLSRGRVRRRDLWAAAVATPGLVTTDGAVTLCTTIPDWQGFNLAAELRGWLRCPVAVENDVNAAARAETWRGACTGMDTLVWVLTGSHIRAALLIGGRLFRGADGAAGEIGWLPALRWEQVRDRSRELQAAQERARPAAMRRLAKALAPGLAALVLTVNPPVLVLAGVAAEAGDGIVERVREHLEPLCLRVPEIRLSRLGADSGATGAVRVALDEVHHRLFPYG